MSEKYTIQEEGRRAFLEIRNMAELPDHPRQGAVGRDGPLFDLTQLADFGPWNLLHEVC